MVINTNISSLSSSRLLAGSAQMLAQSLARLASASEVVSPQKAAAAPAVATRPEALRYRTTTGGAHPHDAQQFSEAQNVRLLTIG